MNYSDEGTYDMAFIQSTMDRNQQRSQRRNQQATHQTTQRHHNRPSVRPDAFIQTTQRLSVITRVQNPYFEGGKITFEYIYI